jgi:hypothetical protein
VRDGSCGMEASIRILMLRITGSRGCRGKPPKVDGQAIMPAITAQVISLLFPADLDVLSRYSFAFAPCPLPPAPRSLLRAPRSLLLPLPIPLPFHRRIGSPSPDSPPSTIHGHLGRLSHSCLLDIHSIFNSPFRTWSWHVPRLWPRSPSGNAIEPEFPPRKRRLPRIAPSHDEVG